MPITHKVHDRLVDVASYHITTRAGSTGNPYVGVMRYSSGAGNTVDATQWKLCKLGELHSLVALGYDVIANSEWTINRIEAGATAGHVDGVADLAFWKARGLAKGASIYVSWDKASSSSKYDAVAAYLAAYESALAGYYHADLYGDDEAIAEMKRRGRIRYGWRSMSDSFSNDGKFYRPGSNWATAATKVAAVSQAHIWQDGNTAFNNGADENVILRLPIGSHLEQGAVATPPVSVPPKAPTPPKAPPAKAPTKTYYVKAGDSMSSIAAAHGMTLAELEKANPRAGHPAGHFDVIWAKDALTVKA